MLNIALNISTAKKHRTNPKNLMSTNGIRLRDLRSRVAQANRKPFFAHSSLSHFKSHVEKEKDCR